MQKITVFMCGITEFKYDAVNKVMTVNCDAQEPTRVFSDLGDGECKMCVFSTDDIKENVGDDNG